MNFKNLSLRMQMNSYYNSIINRFISLIRIIQNGATLI